MDLEISELSEVCSVLRTYISQAKRVNKKDRLKIALKKLETELSFKKSKMPHGYINRVSLRVNKNLCPTCYQVKPTSTLAS
tara:strand:+ start:301 stop:543 length:243 start_codon:yes stop_codon:yes gene_type:complete